MATMMTTTRATPPIIPTTSNEIDGVTEDSVDVVGDVCWIFASPGKYESGKYKPHSSLKYIRNSVTEYFYFVISILV